MPGPMPKFTKTPPALVAAFDAAAPDRTGVVRKTMFGYPALFVNGNMFAFTFGPRVAVRADEKAAKSRFEIMPGRPMRGYVEVPATAAKGAALKRHLAAALAYTEALPAKTKTTAAKKTSATKKTSARKKR